MSTGRYAELQEPLTEGLQQDQQCAVEGEGNNRETVTAIAAWRPCTEFGHLMPYLVAVAMAYGLAVYAYPDDAQLPLMIGHSITGYTQCWDRGAEATVMVFMIPWVGVLLHFGLHYILRGIVRHCWTNFELTEQTESLGVTRETFPREAAIEIHSFIFNCFLGPTALYVAIQCSDAPEDQTMALYPGSNEVACTCYSQSLVVGRGFISLGLYQVLSLILGWERGWDVYFHHILFCFLSFAITQLEALYVLGMFGVAMEISTPALCVVLLFRSVKGHTLLVTLAGYFFALLFLSTRVVLFGWALWRSLSFWNLDSAAQAATLVALGENKQMIIVFLQALFGVGYLLQVVWARQIVAKAWYKLASDSDDKKVEAFIEMDEEI